MRSLTNVRGWRGSDVFTSFIINNTTTTLKQILSLDLKTGTLEFVCWPLAQTQ